MLRVRLSRSYDERGNMLTEKRVHGAATLLTAFTYDGASRVASITYPSGWKVAYTRDVMGRITATKATAPGGADAINCIGHCVSTLRAGQRSDLWQRRRRDA